MLNSVTRHFGFALAVLLSFSAYGGEHDIVFGPKFFYDNTGKTNPEIIYVSGTLTGEGIAYKNNAIAVTCYSDMKECFTYSIEQIGENQVSSLRPPESYPIIKWDRDEVVASGSWDLMNCNKVTISISRKTQTAVWIVEPTNRYQSQCDGIDPTIKKWTIENPPFWKKANAKK